jgi:hypothetical protein
MAPTEVMLVPGARLSRAMAIARSVAYADEMEAQLHAQREQDVVQAQQLAHGLLNARRAMENYRMALADIVRILQNAGPMSDAERVIKKTLIEQRKTMMHEALASVVTGGVNYQATIAADIQRATEGMDIDAYLV